MVIAAADGAFLDALAEILPGAINDNTKFPAENGVNSLSFVKFSSLRSALNTLGNVFLNQAAAAAAIIPAAVDTIITLNFATAGDGGFALWKKFGLAAPAHTGYIFNTVDLNYYEYIAGENGVNVAAMGAVQALSVTTSHVAWQKAITVAIALKKNVVCNGGFYYWTAGVSVGSVVITDWRTIVNRTDTISDVSMAASISNAAIVANQLLWAPSLRFTGPTLIIADFVGAAQFTPVIGYYMNGDSGTAKIEGPLTICGKTTSITNGHYLPPATPVVVPTNLLIGIGGFGFGLVEINGVLVTGCQVGIARWKQYWCRLQDVRVEFCGDCIHWPNGNASDIHNVRLAYSPRGLIAEGDASRFSVHTEQVIEPYTIFTGQCSEYGPGYLEDADAGYATGGAGKFTVNFGVGGGGSKVIDSITKNMLSNPARAGVGGYKFFDTFAMMVMGSRTYGKAQSSDSVSTAHLTNTDFPTDTTNLPIIRFGRSNQGRTQLVTDQAADFFFAGMFPCQFLGVSPGAVGAGLSVTVNVTPANTLPAFTRGYGPILLFSGGDFRLIMQAVATSTTNIAITFTNPTAGSITPSSMSLVAMMELYI